MRAREQKDGITQLPPPPAPPARDANPWSVTGVPPPSRRTSSIRVSRGRDPGTRRKREGLRNVVALGIVAFILVSGLFEALQGGGVEALVGMVIPLFIVAILFLARRHKAQRREGAGPGPGADED